MNVFTTMQSFQIICQSFLLIFQQKQIILVGISLEYSGGFYLLFIFWAYGKALKQLGVIFGEKYDESNNVKRLKPYGTGQTDHTTNSHLSLHLPPLKCQKMKLAISFSIYSVTIHEVLISNSSTLIFFFFLDEYIFDILLLYYSPSKTTVLFIYF